LVGNTAANVGAAALTTRLALVLGGSTWFAYAIGGTTLAILLFGEIVPKGMATTYADRVAPAVAPVGHLLARLLYPIVVALEHERRIIERAFRLDETRAWDIMTPRVDIFAWPADRTLASIATELPTLRFSRVPVYGESVDDIVGILYMRDAYHALVAGQRDVT